MKTENDLDNFKEESFESPATPGNGRGVYQRATTCYARIKTSLCNPNAFTPFFLLLPQLVRSSDILCLGIQGGYKRVLQKDAQVFPDRLPPPLTAKFLVCPQTPSWHSFKGSSAIIPIIIANSTSETLIKSTMQLPKQREGAGGPAGLSPRHLPLSQSLLLWEDTNLSEAE